MGRTCLRPFMTAILLAVSLLGTVLVLSPLSRALAAGHRSGAGNVYALNNPTSAATAAHVVFVQTNDPSPNTVRVLTAAGLEQPVRLEGIEQDLEEVHLVTTGDHASAKFVQDRVG